MIYDKAYKATQDLINHLKTEKALLDKMDIKAFKELHEAKEDLLMAYTDAFMILEGNPALKKDFSDQQTESLKKKTEELKDVAEETAKTLAMAQKVVDQFFGKFIHKMTGWDRNNKTYGGHGKYTQTKHCVSNPFRAVHQL